MISWMARRGWLVELPMAMLALVLGLPIWIALAAGKPAADWRVPFSLQMTGDFGLRTTVYLSGLLVAFALIELIAIVRGRPLIGGGAEIPNAGAGPPGAHPREALPWTRRGGESSKNVKVSLRDIVRPGQVRDEIDDPLFVIEPFYGFLPARHQEDHARRTGYNALLYTKISILLMAGIGVLFAGSWEPAGPFAPFASDTAIRIGMGLYLIAESVHRYVHFARGDPSGSLIGWVAHAATAPLHRKHGSS